MLTALNAQGIVAFSAKVVVADYISKVQVFYNDICAADFRVDILKAVILTGFADYSFV